MSILVNRHTRLLVQGITGQEGLFHTEKMVSYGTNVVAGSCCPRAAGPHPASAITTSKRALGPSFGM